MTYTEAPKPGKIVVGIDGSPALATILACIEGFGPRPDLVVSGINLGINAGLLLASRADRAEDRAGRATWHARALDRVVGG